MSITMTFANDTADALLDDLRRVFPSLVAGTPLPPMQEQPVREPTTAPKEPVEPTPAPKKTRGAKGENPLGSVDAATKTPSVPATTGGGNPSGSAAGASPSDPKDAPAAETPSSSASSEGEASSSASTAASVVDLDTLRAKLKQVGATDGLGHDKVFEILGKYGVKTASTVPEDKRAEVVADLDAALASVK